MIQFNIRCPVLMFLKNIEIFLQPRNKINFTLKAVPLRSTDSLRKRRIINGDRRALCRFPGGPRRDTGITRVAPKVAESDLQSRRFGDGVASREPTRFASPLKRSYLLRRSSGWPIYFQVWTSYLSSDSNGRFSHWDWLNI